VPIGNHTIRVMPSRVERSERRDSPGGATRPGEQVILSFLDISAMIWNPQDAGLRP